MKPTPPHISPQKGPALPSPDLGPLAPGSMSYVSHHTSQNAPNGANCHTVPLRNRKPLASRGFPQLHSRSSLHSLEECQAASSHSSLADRKSKRTWSASILLHLSENQASHSGRLSAPVSRYNRAYSMPDTSKGLSAPKLLVRVTHEKTEVEGGSLTWFAAHK